MISHFNAFETQKCMQNVSRKTSRIYMHLAKHKHRFEEDINKDLARKVVRNDGIHSNGLELGILVGL